MNKRVMLAATMMTVLVSTGCGSGITDARNSSVIRAEESLGFIQESVDEESKLKAACLEQAEYGDILDASWNNAPLAPEVIIEDYVSGSQDYCNQYYTIGDDGCIYATAYLGDAHITNRRYYPGATCDVDWSVEDLIKNYDDQSLPWTQQYRCDYLYSNDYRNCYQIYNDWLLVDDIKVRLIGYEAIGMEPSDILEVYQRGWWDGTMPIFSSDYGTVARLDRWNGTLEYRYEEVTYVDGYDTMQLAYEPYFCPPVCVTTGIDENYRVSYQKGRENDFAQYSSKIFEAEVEIYVDLPNGSMDSFENLLLWKYAGPEIGMYVVMSDRIELYRRGVLMNTWNCDVTAAHPRIEQYNNNSNFGSAVHAWITDETIVSLLPNGEVEVVLDGLTGECYGIGEYTLLELALKDGIVAGYSDTCGVLEIAENIASVDYSWDITLMTGKDDLCYAFFKADYMAMEQQAEENNKNDQPTENKIAIHCLGEKSWEHYLELYLAGLLEMPSTDEPKA